VSLDTRITEVERLLGAREDDQPTYIVDDPECGPSNPVERTAWLQSQIPCGARNVVIIRVVYDEPDEHYTSRPSLFRRGR
jgi:hypothetical protein